MNSSLHRSVVSIPRAWKLHGKCGMHCVNMHMHAAARRTLFETSAPYRDSLSSCRHVSASRAVAACAKDPGPCAGVSSHHNGSFAHNPPSSLLRLQLSNHMDSATPVSSHCIDSLLDKE